MARFERFDAWRRCHELALAVHHATKAWPAAERYGLSSQVRRAAFSAASNIAEGSAKRGPRELARYLDISLGSLAEVAYALIFAREVGILTPEEYFRLSELQSAAEISTWHFYRSLSRPPMR